MYDSDVARVLAMRIQFVSLVLRDYTHIEVLINYGQSSIDNYKQIPAAQIMKRALVQKEHSHIKFTT